MFAWRKKKENPLVVRTVPELKQAVKNNKNEIIVTGDLAKKLKWMRFITPSMGLSLIPLLAGAVAAPFTGGASMLAATSATVALGTTMSMGELCAVILACGVSVSLIISVLKGYDIHAIKDGSEIMLSSKS